jgi:hypothetical protein
MMKPVRLHPRCIGVSRFNFILRLRVKKTQENVLLCGPVFAIEIK